MEADRPRALLRERLFSFLARKGAASPSELLRELGISQPTFSRLMASLRGEVLTFGRTRTRRYALEREIRGVRQPAAVYEVRPRGQGLRRFGELWAVGGNGFYFVSMDGSSPCEGLPWFLQSARPSGFLGRLVPQRHPELELPDNILLWTADHVLRFATRHGWDNSGSFIIGDEACARFLEECERPSNLVEAALRNERYPAIAADLLRFGNAGSSAAGEQPKFLATRCNGDHLTPVLVKFSSRTDEAVGRRIADLLVAEQVALETLGRRGFAVPVASTLSMGERTFLEVERFDRDGVASRTGLVSLDLLDAEFVGSDLTSWTVSVEALAARNLVPRSEVPRVRSLETFGRLIGNTDMHFGNLAFFMDGTRVTALAPVYDMLPMYYHPRQGDVPQTDHPLPILGPDVADVADAALEAAIEFWGQLAEDPRVSAPFRGIAARSALRTANLRPRVAMLSTTVAR